MSKIYRHATNEYTKAVLEKLRHELDNLVDIKSDNYDDEVLKISRKLDKIIVRYYRLKRSDEAEATA